MEIANQDRPDFDDVVRQASRARTGDEKIRIRMQPGTYNKTIRSGAGGYTLWPGIAYTVLCENLEEVRQLKKALDTFFEAIHRGGVEQVTETLKAVRQV